MTIPNDQAIKPEEAVLPCPFCGSKDVSYKWTGHYNDYQCSAGTWSFGCGNCMASIPMDDKHDFAALQAWNRRA